MSNTKTYTLACHCQTHVYRLTLPAGQLEKEGAVCDCTWCLKRRIIWAFVPKESLIHHRGAGVDGTEELTEYRFATKTAAHKFCGKCGTYLLMEHNRPDEDKHFINLRAIRDPDFDIWDLPLTLYNGARHPGEYKEVTVADIPGAQDALITKGKTMGGETEIYAGSCHCQSIKFAVVCKPLHSAEDEETVDCACSICGGNGALWVYPYPEQVIFHPSEPSNPHKPLASTVSRYTFGKGTNIHSMCKTCGCHIYEHREVNKDADMGLNVALFSRAGEWMRDVHGLGEGNAQFKGRMSEQVSKTIPGLRRNDRDRKIEPQYQIRL